MKNNLQSILRKIRNYKNVMQSCFVWSFEEEPIQSHVEISKLEEEFSNNNIPNNFPSILNKRNIIMENNEIIDDSDIEINEIISDSDIETECNIQSNASKEICENRYTNIICDNNNKIDEETELISATKDNNFKDETDLISEKNDYFDEIGKNKPYDSDLNEFINKTNLNQEEDTKYEEDDINNCLNELYKKAEQISIIIKKRIFDRKDIKELQKERNEIWGKIIKFEDKLISKQQILNTVELENQNFCEHCTNIKDITQNIFQQSIDSFQFEVIQKIENSRDNYVIYFWDIEESNICLQVSCYMQDGISLIYSTLRGSTDLINHLNENIIQHQSAQQSKCIKVNDLDEAIRIYQSYSQNQICKLYLQLSDNFKENIECIQNHPNIRLIIFMSYQTPFQINSPNILKQSFFSRNIVFEVIREDKIHHFLMQWIQSHQLTEESGIVYCNSSNESEITARILSSRHLTCALYHDCADTSALRQWNCGSAKVLIVPAATKLRTDRIDVRYSVHIALPSSVLSYCSSCSVVGRDNAPSRCLILYNSLLLDRKIGSLTSSDQPHFARVSAYLSSSPPHRRDLLQSLIAQEESSKAHFLI